MPRKNTGTINRGTSNTGIQNRSIATVAGRPVGYEHIINVGQLRSKEIVDRLFIQQLTPGQLIEQAKAKHIFLVDHSDNLVAESNKQLDRAKSEIATSLLMMKNEFERRLEDPRNLKGFQGIAWQEGEPLAGLVETAWPFNMADTWRAYLVPSTPRKYRGLKKQQNKSLPKGQRASKTHPQRKTTYAAKTNRLLGTQKAEGYLERTFPRPLVPVNVKFERTIETELGGQYYGYFLTIVKVGIKAELKGTGQRPELNAILDAGKATPKLEAEFENKYFNVKKLELSKDGVGVTFSIGEGNPIGKGGVVLGKIELKLNTSPLSPITVEVSPVEIPVEDLLFLEHLWNGKLALKIKIIIVPNLDLLAKYRLAALRHLRRTGSIIIRATGSFFRTAAGLSRTAAGIYRATGIAAYSGASALSVGLAAGFAVAAWGAAVLYVLGEAGLEGKGTAIISNFVDGYAKELADITGFASPYGSSLEDRWKTDEGITLLDMDWANVLKQEGRVYHKHGSKGEGKYSLSNIEKAGRARVLQLAKFYFESLGRYFWRGVVKYHGMRYQKNRRIYWSILFEQAKRGQTVGIEPFIKQKVDIKFFN